MMSDITHAYLSSFTMTGRIYAYALDYAATWKRPPSIDDVAEEFGLTYGAALSMVSDLREWGKWPTAGKAVKA